MPRRTSTIALSPWVGGLNTAQDPIVLGLTPEGQQNLTQADNIIFTTSGGRKKRGGQARFNTTAVTTGTTAATPTDLIYGTTYWRNNSASTKTEELVTFSEGGQMFYGASYGTLTSITVPTTATFSQGLITTETMTEKLFIGNSKTQTMLVYTGGGTAPTYASANTTVVGTFPNGNLVRQHISRLWVAGDTANPDRLYYSNSELPFAYGTAGGFIDIYPGDGDPVGITAIFPSVNVRELYVAKRSSLYRIDTSELSPANWAVVPVSRSVGCVAHNSVVAVDQGDMFYASDRGIHSLQQILATVGILEGKFISAPIQEDYNELSNKNLMSALWAPDLNSYLFSGQRFGMTSIETVYGYNVTLAAWYRWTSVPANFLFKRLNVSSEEYQYYSCGDSTSASDRGFINKLQQTGLWDFSSQTGNIGTIIKTPLMYPGGNFINERNWLNLILLVRSRDESVIDLTFTVDEFLRGTLEMQQKIVGANILGSASGSTYLLGSTFILGSPTGAKPIFGHVNGVGNAIQVTIEHDTIGKDLEVYGLAIEYTEGEESQNAYRAFQ